MLPAPVLAAAATAAAVAGKFAGTWILKGYVVSHLAGLQAFLAAHIGATAATTSTGLLASATAAAWWVKLQGGSEKEMEDAASKRVKQDVAKGIVKWLLRHA